MKKLLTFCSFIAFVPVAMPSMAIAQPVYDDYGAQNNGQLMNRILQLENQLQTLNQQVFRGNAPPPAYAVPSNNGGNNSGGSKIAADQEVRLGQLEDQLRRLNGTIEQLQFQQTQINQQIQKMASDNEVRFSALEKAAQPPAQPQPAPAVTPPPATPAPSPAPTGQTPPPAPSNTAPAASNLPDGSANQLYQQAYGQMNNQQYDAASNNFHEFLKKYPKHELAANTRFWLADIEFSKGNYQQAAISFAENYQKYPKGSKAPDSLLKLSLSLEKLGKNSDSCLTLKELAQKFPKAGENITRSAAQQKTRLGCS
ncbi:MAG: tol-pal system protein YbgF [Alphaproteobacteria bacterium]